MSTQLRVQDKPTSDLPTAPVTSAPKSTFQGFTYAILKDGQTNHTLLLTTEAQFVKIHIPTYNKVLSVLVDTSKDLALKNTDYGARASDLDQDQLYKDVCGDLRVYRKHQTTFHTQVLAFNIMTRDVTVWVRCLKPSAEPITFTRVTPSKRETSLVQQAEHLDTMKKTAYEAAKKGILRNVTSLQTQLKEKLGAYDAEMDKLENTASYIKACLMYSSINPQRYLAMKYHVELPEVDSLTEEESEVDVSDFSILKSYKDVDNEDETPDNKEALSPSSSSSMSGSTPTPTLPPSSSSSMSGSTSVTELPPASSSSVSSSTSVAELPPASSSSVSGSTSETELPPASSSSMSSTTPELESQSSLLSRSTPSLTSGPSVQKLQPLVASSSGPDVTNMTEADKEVLNSIPDQLTDLSEDEGEVEASSTVVKRKMTGPTVPVTGRPKPPATPSKAPVGPPPKKNLLLKKEQPSKK